eukprot:gene6161-6871_t
MNLINADVSNKEGGRFAVSVHYPCEGEVEFHLKVKRVQATDAFASESESPAQFHLSVCKSSWYNDWCSKPKTQFVDVQCLDNLNRKPDRNITYCVFDRSTMCDKDLIGDNKSGWYYSTYVVRVLASSSNGTIVIKEFPLSPFQYEFNCPSGEYVVNKVRCMFSRPSKRQAENNSNGYSEFEKEESNADVKKRGCGSAKPKGSSYKKYDHIPNEDSCANEVEPGQHGGRYAALKTEGQGKD